MLPREHVLLRWETLRRHNIPLGEPLYARPLDGSGQPRRVLAWAGRKLQPASQSTTAGVHRSHGESGVELWVGQATTRSEPRAYLHQPREDAAAAKPRDATSDGLGEGSAVDDELLALAELPLHAPHVFREWGVPAPRGILVHGPAGAGIGARLSRALDAHYVHVSAGGLAPHALWHSCPPEPRRESHPRKPSAHRCFPPRLPPLALPRFPRRRRPRWRRPAPWRGGASSLPSQLTL